MNKILTVFVFFFISMDVLADYSGGHTLTRIRVHVTEVYFDTTSTVPNTCNSWGEVLRFDHTTDLGTKMLTVLLTAKASGKKVAFWYIATTAPGKDHHSGCNEETMATLTAVAIL